MEIFMLKAGKYDQNYNISQVSMSMNIIRITRII